MVTIPSNTCTIALDKHVMCIIEINEEVVTGQFLIKTQIMRKLKKNITSNYSKYFKTDLEFNLFFLFVYLACSLYIPDIHTILW